MGGVLWGTVCVLLGYFAAHSISRVTQYLGVTSGVIAAVIVIGLVWAWRRRTHDG
jgi:membrane protein DedA with SNARE-associated domain